MKRWISEAMHGTPVTGVEHWTTKRNADGDVRLFLWEKFVGSPDGKPAVLFVHGSSMASQPTFDLTVPGRPDSSVMDWFAQRGFVCWCVDMEGYGRSDKRATSSATSPTAPTTSPRRPTTSRARAACSSFMAYGISSGALRAALFAQRHPERVARLALDAFVWTGEGAPTLEQRRKKLPEFLANKRRPIDRAFVHSIFAARPSGLRRAARRRRVRRRDPGARRLDAQRHLHRHVQQAAGRRSGEDHDADDRAARPVRRHRRRSTT